MVNKNDWDREWLRDHAQELAILVDNDTVVATTLVKAIVAITKFKRTYTYRALEMTDGESGPQAHFLELSPVGVG